MIERGRRDKIFLRCGLLGALPLLAGCGLFSSKPALPKHASIEHVAKPETDFAALVDHADVIYFPSDRAASGARTEPAALLVEALEHSGKPLAIGWDLIDASQQSLLDEIRANPAAKRPPLIDELDIIGSGRAREHCRAALRDAPSSTRLLALRCPASLIMKLATGETPTPEETRFLPRGYRTAPGGLEAYAEHLAPHRGGTTDAALANSYGALVLNRQFIAEQIVHRFREVAGSKLLVFLAASDLEEGRGVPTYVAQKISLRQLVLGSDRPNESSNRLLTGRSRDRRRGFEIVDRAPVATHD
ncbi:MAG: hypothetical protein ACR2HH_10545 [Chthoniobacterales bacterium]